MTAKLRAEKVYRGAYILRIYVYEKMYIIVLTFRFREYEFF